MITRANILLDNDQIMTHIIASVAIVCSDV